MSTQTTETELPVPAVSTPKDEARPAVTPVLTITPRRHGFFPVKELWEFRELLYFLAWRDIKIRYKQTVFGAAWAVIQPLVTMVIFTAIFHRFARITTGDIPYPVFAYAGLLPWNLFAGSLQRSILSLVGSTHLITRVYFPRQILPIAATFSAAVDFAVAFAVLIVMGVGYGVPPTWRLLALPAAVAMVMLTAMGVGMWLSALNVKYRDVGHTVPFLIQVWMFASPVAYPLSLVPGHLHGLYAINPMAGAIELFRWAVAGGPAPSVPLLAIGFGATLVLLAWGLFYFRQMERSFADII
ncbi:MAG: ABC transporter permease [Armatimonadota bacterium]|nr:ABC transporter permease [Armatimonadota bacterium]MDR7494823.1 ABC transporter permease [Armatimonadota bacterium]